VVDDQLGNDAQAAGVGGVEDFLEVGERAVGGVDFGVIGDVVAVVLQRRGIEGQQPDGGDTGVLEVVELLGKSLEVAECRRCRGRRGRAVRR